MRVTGSPNLREGANEEIEAARRTGAEGVPKEEGEAWGRARFEREAPRVAAFTGSEVAMKQHLCGFTWG